MIAEELESVVQLFGEVLRDYRIPAEEIEAYEQLARRNGYSALFDDEVDTSVFRCETGQDCFDSRTVKVREGAAVAGRTLASLKLKEDFGLLLKSLRRDGEEFDQPSADLVLQAGDELILSGPTQSFASNAALFRAAPGSADAVSVRSQLPVSQEENAMAFSAETGISLETEITYVPTVDASVCGHLDRIKPVFPSASGCEECLRSGDEWNHLRLCLTCGHVGCCDTSKNKHATAHFHDTDHPVMKSIELFDDWAWCFVDEEYV